MYYLFCRFCIKPTEQLIYIHDCQKKLLITYFAMIKFTQTTLAKICICLCLCISLCIKKRCTLSVPMPSFGYLPLMCSLLQLLFKFGSLSINPVFSSACSLLNLTFYTSLTHMFSPKVTLLIETN